MTDSGGKCLGEGKSLAGESEGRWEVRLPILPAMAAAKLSISTDRGDQKAIADILVGEVWLASGQSNMTRSVGNADFPKEVMEVARQEAADAGEDGLGAGGEFELQEFGAAGGVDRRGGEAGGDEGLGFGGEGEEGGGFGVI